MTTDVSKLQQTEPQFTSSAQPRQATVYERNMETPHFQLVDFHGLLEAKSFRVTVERVQCDAPHVAS